MPSARRAGRCISWSASRDEIGSNKSVEEREPQLWGKSVETQNGGTEHMNDAIMVRRLSWHGRPNYSHITLIVSYKVAVSSMNGKGEREGNEERRRRNACERRCCHVLCFSTFVWRVKQCARLPHPG